jgi:DNA-binding winged helix-turn-helix (wHTH) protein/Tfp pilus assembly protein PilF
MPTLIRHSRCLPWQVVERIVLLPVAPACPVLRSGFRAAVTFLYRFADFELDGRSRELRQRGRALPVAQQPLRILATLVAAPGALVTRDELRARVWGPGIHVDFDRAINKAIAQLRQLLDDDASRPRFIETLPGRGYRFMAGVVRVTASREIDDRAREAFLKGRHFWNRRTPDDLRRSVTYFRQAIETDPEYAPSWAGLANAYVMIGIFGLQPPDEIFPPARAAAARALALDATLAEAHTVAAEIQKLYEWDWIASERSFLKAIELDGDYPVAHHWYAQLLSILGRHDEARREIETASRCDPLSPVIAAFRSYVACEARHYDTAVATARDALELDSHAPLTHYMLGRAYDRRGDAAQALTAFETAARLAGWLPAVQAALAFVCARSGGRERAAAILDDLRERQHDQYVSPVDLAQVHLGLGDSDGAIGLLEEAHRTRAVRTVVIGDPFFSELGHDGRYRRLLDRMRLPFQEARG